MHRREDRRLVGRRLILRILQIDRERFFEAGSVDDDSTAGVGEQLHQKVARECVGLDAADRAASESALGDLLLAIDVRTRQSRSQLAVLCCSHERVDGQLATFAMHPQLEAVLQERLKKGPRPDERCALGRCQGGCLRGDVVPFGPQPRRSANELLGAQGAPGVARLGTGDQPEQRRSNRAEAPAGIDVEARLDTDQRVPFD